VLCIGLVSNAVVARCDAASTETTQAKLGKLLKCRAVIVVRHAEKDGGQEDGAPINKAGQERAKALASALGELDVTKILVSYAKRTQQTAQPLIDALSQKGRRFQCYTNLGSIYTHADEIDIRAVTQSLEENDVVLIVSHSSRLPQLLADLGDPNQDAEVFDKMWIFVPNAARNGLSVIHTRYGRASQ